MGPGAGGAGQTRAAGLTRAILDTFPVVKFGRSDDQQNTGAPVTEAKDIESNRTSPAVLEMAELKVAHIGRYSNFI